MSSGDSAMNARFDKIEGKIDRLSEVVVDLARVKEQILSLQKESLRMNGQICNLMDAQNKMAKEVADNTGVTNILKRAGYAFAAAIAISLAAHFDFML